MHLSRYQYLPTYILKLTSQTEFSEGEFQDFRKQMKAGIPLQIIQNNSRNRLIQNCLSRFPRVDPNEIGTGQFIIPWFLNCNRERYPSLFENGKEDMRYHMML